MEVICKDWDIRYNFYAFKACIESKNFLSVNKALSFMGLTEDLNVNLRYKKPPTSKEQVEKALGEKILMPKYIRNHPKISTEMKNQMQRLYDELGMKKIEIAKLYGVSEGTTSKYIKGNRRCLND